MRNWIILIIIAIILIGAGIWQINYVEESSAYAISDAEYAVTLVENNNFDAANKHINELENTWKDMKNIWSMFIIHDEIDKIEAALLNFKTYTKLNNKEEAIVYSEELIQVLNHISAKQKVKVENVF